MRRQKDPDELKLLLQQYKRGTLSERGFIDKLTALNFESIGFATVDHHRQLRQGFPEVILCQGKTPRQAADIASRIARNARPLIATRATREHFKAVKRAVRNARNGKRIPLRSVRRKTSRPSAAR